MPTSSVGQTSRVMPTPVVPHQALCSEDSDRGLHCDPNHTEMAITTMVPGPAPDAGGPSQSTPRQAGPHVPPLRRRDPSTSRSSVSSRLASLRESYRIKGLQ